MPWDSQSFQKFYKRVCKFDKQMGMDFNVPTPGEVIYWMTLEEKHLSSPQTIHGGALAALMDATLGLSALSYAVTLDQLCSTVEFKMNYFAPPKPGDVLEGKGKIDFTGNRLVVTSADLYQKTTGKLLAKGLGTFNLYPMSKYNWPTEENE